MAAFGDAARHTIVSGVPDALGARAAIPAGVAYEVAQAPPPLTGRPSVARFEAIAKYMRGFDLVLTYNWGAIDGVMARRVFSKDSPPLVHHEDGFNADEAQQLNRMRNLYRRFALPAAHAVVVPSYGLERVARSVWKQPIGRLRRISNGIPVERYAGPGDLRAIPGFRRKEGEIVIGTVAGLRAVKDLPLLVRAFGGLRGRAKLVIVGEGPERQAIQDAAEAMFVSDQLFLPGFVADPSRVFPLFDIFALTSKSEQQPIVVMEAMAAGLPVVAPPVGDVAEMVAEENRPFLSPDRYEVRLRDRIQWLIDSPDHRSHVGRANRARAAAMFDERTMIAAYKSLYEEALGRPGALG